MSFQGLRWRVLHDVTFIGVGGIMLFVGNTRNDAVLMTLAAVLIGWAIHSLVYELSEWMHARQEPMPRPDQEGVHVEMTFVIDGSESDVGLTIGRSEKEGISDEMLAFIEESGYVGPEIINAIEDGNETKSPKAMDSN